MDPQISGAVIGAVISGVFTLVGVWLTVRSTRPQQPTAPPPMNTPQNPTYSPPATPETRDATYSPPIAPTTPSYSTVSQPSTVGIGRIIRDVGIIVLITQAGGFLLGMMSGSMLFEDPELFQGIGLVASVFFLSIGFFISGVLAERNTRWKHLALVAVGVTVALLIVNALVFSSVYGVAAASGDTGIALAIQAAIAMGIGGGLANAVKRT